MATETQSDEAPFWIVEVVGKEQEVPRDYVCPLTAAEHVDVIFGFSGRENGALGTPVAPYGHSQSGAVSSDVGDRLLRCALPRAVPSTSIGKIKLKEATITPPRANARPSSGSGVLSVAPVVRYELKAADKALVLERCRVF